jgi:SRSO17 transposase
MAMREQRLATAWMRELEAVAARIGAFVLRPESRDRVRRFMRVTVAGDTRRNGWQLAEAAAEPTPHGMQRLVASAAWDVEGVRDDLRTYVVQALGTQDSVLIVDETGFLKKGTKSAGVQRQYSGTAGRIENCQIGVFLAYATARGHAFVDRELYIPESWHANRPRCREAGIPDTRRFRTKPQLAQGMLARAFAAGLRPAWVLGDTVYGNDRALRSWLETQQQAFLLGLRSDERLWVWWHGTPRQVQVGAVADALPAAAWTRRSAGAGSKGARTYDWALVPLARGGAAGHHALLVRQHLTTGDRAYAVVFTPRRLTLQTLVQVAGRRWAIEQAFETSKQEIGLDQYEVRTYAAWYRFMTLTLYAHAFLAAMRARQSPRKRGLRPAPRSSR